MCVHRFPVLSRGSNNGRSEMDLLKPIFDHVDDLQSTDDRDCFFDLYKYTNKLFRTHMDSRKKSRSPKLVCSRWSIGLVTTWIFLYLRCDEAVQVPKATNPYLLTGKRCSTQVGHNYLSHGKIRYTAYIFISTTKRGSFVEICSGSYWFRKFLDKNKAQLVKGGPIETRIIKTLRNQ